MLVRKINCIESSQSQNFVSTVNPVLRSGIMSMRLRVRAKFFMRLRRLRLLPYYVASQLFSKAQKLTKGLGLFNSTIFSD
jgi:hypothetical protein